MKVNVQTIIKSEVFIKWLQDHITFEPYATTRSFDQVSVHFDVTETIAVQRTYYPQGFIPTKICFVSKRALVEANEYTWGCGIKGDVPEGFEGTFEYLEEPYAENQYYPSFTNFEAYILFWMYMEKKDTFQQFQTLYPL